MKQTYTFQWKRDLVTKKIQIARADRNEETREFYKVTHNAEREISQMDGEFEVTIDIAQLTHDLIVSAAHSKSGRSQRIGKIAVCKRIHERVLSQEVKTFPIPDGMSEVK